MSLPPPAPSRLAAQGGGRKLTIVRASDPRTDPATVAIGFASPASLYKEQQQMRIRSNPTVAVWVGDALTAALEQSGFRVERAETVASASTPLVLTVAVRDASAVGFEDPSQTQYLFEARVLARVELYQRGELVQKRTYSGASTGALRPPQMSDYDYGPLLAEAIADMLGKAVPDLAAALARETS